MRWKLAASLGLAIAMAACSSGGSDWRQRLNVYGEGCATTPPDNYQLEEQAQTLASLPIGTNATDVADSIEMEPSQPLLPFSGIPKSSIIWTSSDRQESLTAIFDDSDKLESWIAVVDACSWATE